MVGYEVVDGGDSGIVGDGCLGDEQTYSDKISIRKIAGYSLDRLRCGW